MREEGQRQSRDEGVYPHREACQFHGHVVAVHSVHATASDLAAEQTGGLNLDTVCEVAKSIECCAAKFFQLGQHLGYRVQREEP